MSAEERPTADDQLAIRSEEAVDQMYDQLVPQDPAVWQTTNQHCLLASRRVINHHHQGDRCQDQELRSEHLGRGKHRE